MNDTVHRFFGGSPLAVLVRLILLSILVGVVLAALGFDPQNLFPSLRRLVLRIWDMGWDAVSWAWSYFVLGALLVIPIWLIVRVVKVQSQQRT
jgi:hypothetical protein